MEEINILLNSMEIEELESLKGLINSHEMKKKEERKNKIYQCYKKHFNRIKER